MTSYILHIIPTVLVYEALQDLYLQQCLMCRGPKLKTAQHGSGLQVIFSKVMEPLAPAEVCATAIISCTSDLPENDLKDQINHKTGAIDYVLL